MKKTTLAIWTPLLLFILGAEQAPKKNAPEPKVSISVSLGQTALWVGDVLPYTIRAIHDPDAEFALDHLKKESLALAPFVVRGISVEQGDWSPNKKLLEITLQLATYEIGRSELTIPPIRLYYFLREAGMGRKDNQAVTVQIPAARVGLRSTLSGGQLKPRDTKPVSSVDFAWIASALVFGLVGLSFAGTQAARWVWTTARTPRAKRRPLARHGRDRLVHESLAKIRAIGSGTDEELARFYHEISHCLRRYLQASLELEALCLTPEEIERALGQAGTDGSLVQQIRALLDRCETVQYGRDSLRVARERRDEVQATFEKTVAAMRSKLAG